MRDVELLLLLLLPVATTVRFFYSLQRAVMSPLSDEALGETLLTAPAELKRTARIGVLMGWIQAMRAFLDTVRDGNWQHLGPLRDHERFPAMAVGGPNAVAR